MGYIKTLMFIILLLGQTKVNY